LVRMSKVQVQSWIPLLNWHNKAGFFFDSGWPPFGDSFGACHEFEGVCTVLVQVTETGGFPTAKGIVGNWHRDGHIDAYHANIDSAGELACSIAVASKNGHPVTVFMFGWQCQGLFEIVGANNGQHWTEDLILIDRHIFGGVIKDSRTNVEAIFMSIDFDRESVQHQLGAFVDPDGNSGFNAFFSFGGHYWTKVR